MTTIGCDLEYTQGVQFRQGSQDLIPQDGTSPGEQQGLAWQVREARARWRKAAGNRWNPRCKALREKEVRLTEKLQQCGQTSGRGGEAEGPDWLVGSAELGRPFLGKPLGKLILLWEMPFYSR